MGQTKVWLLSAKLHKNLFVFSGAFQLMPIKHDVGKATWLPGTVTVACAHIRERGYERRQNRKRAGSREKATRYEKTISSAVWPQTHQTVFQQCNGVGSTFLSNVLLLYWGLNIPEESILACALQATECVPTCTNTLSISSSTVSVCS